MLIDRPSLVLADLPDLKLYRFVNHLSSLRMICMICKSALNVSHVSIFQSYLFASFPNITLFALTAMCRIASVPVIESKKEFDSKILLLRQDTFLVTAEYTKAARLSDLASSAIELLDTTKKPAVLSVEECDGECLATADDGCEEGEMKEEEEQTERDDVDCSDKPNSIHRGVNEDTPRPCLDSLPKETNGMAQQLITYCRKYKLFIPVKDERIIVLNTFFHGAFINLTFFAGMLFDGTAYLMEQLYCIIRSCTK